MQNDNGCNQPLSGIDSFILSRFGARFEAGLFASLQSCPFVIRSFEFAIADGAIWATKDAEPPASGSSYSERFWQLNDEVRKLRYSPAHWNRALVLFDVKSKISARAEDQIYITPVQQRAKVSFYIGICAANPEYIELIPNRLVGRPVPSHDDRRDVAVNTSRKSLLPPSAYGYLSPCNSPYRMPISQLPDALRSIQQCAQGLRDYTNPSTLVTFTGWRPKIEQGNDCLIPREDSQHFTSFRGLLEIWRGIRIARELHSLPVHLELMWLQPLLADFKLVIADEETDLGSYQCFVQYKIDGLYRSPSSSLAKVAIARNKRRGGTSYYFTEHERFDYLFYQFDYKDHEKRAWTQFFFIPEKVLPEEFYVTETKESSFDRAEFKPYWIHMDQSGQWAKRVYEIIQQTRCPRLEGTRPSRQHIAADKIPRPAPNLGKFRRFYEDLFYTVMTQCATRCSGLLIVLSRGHPQGDLAYCRYSWTTEEQRLFLEDKTLPCTIDGLPPTTPLVPFHVYTRSSEVTSRGPNLTTAEFQRLNEDPHRRLLIFDLFGADGHNSYSPLLVIPSDDISPTHDQVALYRLNSAKHKVGDFQDRVPLLAELLHTGLIPTDYIISASGPLLFETDADPWGELWVLLNKFTGVDEFTYPNGNYCRRPREYRVTVQELHQRLADKHMQVSVDQSASGYTSETDGGE